MKEKTRAREREREREKRDLSEVRPGVPEEEEEEEEEFKAEVNELDAERDEVCTSVKRDLLKRQKRPTKASKGAY
jgi:hypothetical protein